MADNIRELNLPEKAGLIRCFEDSGKSKCIVIVKDPDVLREIANHLNNSPCIKYLVEDKENNVFRDLEDFE